MSKIIATSFLLGLSFGIGPCIASCGPLLISYTAGTNKNIIKSFFMYLLFSLSRIFIYVVFSLAIFLLGQFIIDSILSPISKYVFISAGTFIMIIGVLICLGKNPNHKFCQRLQNFFLRKDTKTVIILGLIVGILPCAPLISVLSYIGLVAKHWFDALLYGLFFGLGTAMSPLLLFVIFSGFITKAIVERNKFYRVFNIVFGMVIILLGLELASRSFR
jgi:sulfite exporter TauE/SafE